MFKLIPHIANGSWVIRQSVGSTPVIIGKVGAGGKRGTVRVARGTASCSFMVSLGRRRGGGRRGLEQSAPVITVGLGDSSNQMGFDVCKMCMGLGQVLRVISAQHQAGRKGPIQSCCLLAHPCISWVGAPSASHT